MLGPGGHLSTAKEIYEKKGRRLRTVGDKKKAPYDICDCATTS